jgi:uncharacterized protein (DUF169 family)
MSTYDKAAEDLSAMLELDHPPVAVSFHDDALSGAPVAPVAAGCCFWARAELSVQVTRSTDHSGCSVGSYVHGLLPLERAADAGDVAALVASAWVTPADLTTIPVLDRSPKTIVYEPLRDAERVDVVLLRLGPKSLMALQGAVPELTLVAKPQCQIMARAARGDVVVSPGCAVSRVRTGLPDGELTAALPGARLSDVIARLRISRDADAAVAQYAAPSTH